MDRNLTPYVLSKWVCPQHGYFNARTRQPVDPGRPIACPECVAHLVSQCAGHTVQSVPFVSKPRLPNVRVEPRSSGNVPVRKRGISW